MVWKKGLALEIRPQSIRFGNCHILYDPLEIANPAEELFEARTYLEKGLLIGQAKGRGQAFFVRHGEQTWVLRHYRRGGLVGKVLRDQYLGWHLAATRPWREWQLLAALHAQGLPVPRPVAARVSRHFGYYRADLITRLIADTRSLAQILQREPLPEKSWSDIGVCVRRFHRAGVYHADLNAHNILLNAAGDVFLIDFDRGELRRPGGWFQANVDRLLRSLHKLETLPEGLHFSPRDWDAFGHGYHRG